MKNRIFLITCLSLLLSKDIFASTAATVKQANKLFESKEYDAAVNKYNEALNKEPESGIIHYNAGTSLYKAGRYNDSIQHLQKALLTDDELLKQKVSYNLGNALYKAGIAREKKDSGFAILSMEKALGHYQESIRLDPKDEDAKANYEFVKKEIERIKQQQTQQQQDQPSNQNQQQDQQQNQQQDQQQQQEQQDSSQQQPQGQGGDQQKPQDDQREQQQPQDNGGSDGNEEPSQDEAQEPGSSDEQQDQKEEDGEGDSGNQQPSDYNNQMQQGTQGQDEGELTPKEAQMILRGFEQREQPQKLLNVFKGKIDTSPVEKDW